MAAITVRNLDDEVQRGIKRRAAANNRSMEAEARAILSAAVIGSGFASDWVEATSGYRGDAISVPRRSAPRDTDLS